MIKKLVVLFLLLSTLAVASLVGGYLWYKSNLRAVSSDPTKKTLLIKKGQTADSIGKKLVEVGLVRSELAFKLYLKQTGLGNKIPPGEFRIPGNLDTQGVVAALLEGPTEVWVTIPEGLRMEQLPLRFAEAVDMPLENRESFVDAFFAAAEGLEGYLYPDTYLVPKDVTAAQAVTLMKSTFDKKYASFEKTNTKLSPAEIVTLASIIERETRDKGDERPMVAGVLMNRLEIGMPLQVDASVQYVLANMRCKPKNVECSDWWPTVLRGDYGLQSPYNTYQIPGLPPHPIASPGATSLSAALNPSDNEYFYYIHDRSGQIHFAKTLEEHNANVRQYIN